MPSLGRECLWISRQTQALAWAPPGAVLATHSVSEPWIPHLSNGHVIPTTQASQGLTQARNWKVLCQLWSSSPKLVMIFILSSEGGEWPYLLEPWFPHQGRWENGEGANRVSSYPLTLKGNPGHTYSTIWRVSGMGILNSCAFITCKTTGANHP